MNHTLIDDIVGEVDIPDGGTLSRVLYKNDLLRLVAFGFDAGEELTDHSSSMPVIIQVLSGRLVVGVEDAEYEMTGSSWLSLDAGVRHSVRALEPSRLLLTMIRSA